MNPTCPTDPKGDLIRALSRDLSDPVLLGEASLADKSSAGTVMAEGNITALDSVFGLMDTFDIWPDIVMTPVADSPRTRCL